MRILLVDDMAMVREGLRSVLQSHANLTVVAEAENGLEAIELTRTFHPDVIVMDVNMPKLNGIEATRQILSEFPEITVIGLSIDTEKKQREMMLHAGAVDYLKKDSSAEVLFQAICAARPKI